MAQARVPFGISSAAMIGITPMSAVANVRATSCDPASHGSDGASAPVAAVIVPIVKRPSSTGRRPTRSARATRRKASIPPSRTVKPVAPCAVPPESNSSAANVSVWPSSVLR